VKYTQLAWNSPDGIAFYGQFWEPDTPPRAVVALVHGLGEHSGRYAHVAAALNEAGYAVMALDLRGHGKSTGQRGHFPSGEALLGDLDLFLGQVEARFPGRPRFLYGHSLGGILVLYYTLRRRPALAGVVATSSGLITALHQQKSKVALARILGTILPTLSMPSGLENAALSRDPEVAHIYGQDPLVHNQVTLRTGNILVEATRWTLDHAAEFPLPLLLVHGSADRIAFPESSVQCAAPARGDCTLKVWEGLYHETHNEPEKEEVLGYTVEWLNKHLPG